MGPLLVRGPVQVLLLFFFFFSLGGEQVLLLTRYGELTIDGNFHLKHACGTPQDSVLFRRFCGE